MAASLGGAIKPKALLRIAGPDVLPLISDKDISKGGFHFSGFSQSKPVISKVTWCHLPKRAKDGIWRGYTSCLQVFGQNFAPGCRIILRFRGTTNAINDGISPNIYSGHYLEVSVPDSDETPIRSLAYEYTIKNPHYSSEWVPFTYEYDRVKEMQKAQKLLSEGESAYTEKRFKDAIEPLRAAQVRYRGLVGSTDELFIKAQNLWKESLYESGIWKRT